MLLRPPTTRAIAGAFARPHPSMRQVVRPREVVRLRDRPLAAKKAKADPQGQVGQPPPSLAPVLRRESYGNWLMPYMAAITPTYIESLLRGGLAGNHVQMHQLFDLMWDSDPEIQACIGEFVDGVQDKKFVFMPYAEDDEEPTPSALEKCRAVRAALTGMRPDPAACENNLYNTVKDVLAARWHGCSVLEVDYYDTYGSGRLNMKTIPGLPGQWLFPRATYWVNPVCYGWSRDGRVMLAVPQSELHRVTDRSRAKDVPLVQNLSQVVPNATTNGWVEFPKDKFIVAVNNGKTGSPLSVSQLRCLAWWWVASNFCGDFLMRCAELFGIPFRSATYGPSVSEPQRAEVRQMLQSMGSCGWAMMPDGVELKFDTAMNTGAQSPQAFLFHFADSQKRKVILHQTMTGGAHDSMGKGGGKAFGDVESDKTDTCIAAGARFACDVLNEQLVPGFLRWNYPDGDVEAPTVSLVDDAEGGLVDAQKFQTLAQIMDVPSSHLRRIFRVPKPTADDQVAGVDGGVQGAQAAAQERMQRQQMQVQQAQAMSQQVQAQDPDAVEGRRALQARTGDSEAGCLMAMVPPDQRQRFVDLANQIPADLLAGDGAEDEPHVTVLYGFHTDFDPKFLKQWLDKPVTFVLGKLSRFKCPDYDVVKFDVDSLDLVALHKALAKEFAGRITPSEHKYKPHLTVAYVKRGAKLDLVPGTLVGKKFTVSSLLYSLPKREGRQVLTAYD